MKLATESRYPPELIDRHFGPVGTTLIRYMLRGRSYETKDRIGATKRIRNALHRYGV